MTKTVLGIFQDNNNAESAVSKLEEDGYDPKNISIVMKDREEGEKLGADTGTNISAGATSGATTGLVLGGLAGLVASFVIPGLGAFFIGGPIAAALGLGGAAATTVSGATTGAIAGGLIGALMGFGLTEDEAKEYEEHVNQGAILVAVPARDNEESRVEDILADNNADNIRIASHNQDTKANRDRSGHDEYRSHTFAGAKGGKSDTSKKSKGKGWHGDPKGHAIAGSGNDVPERGEGK
jgi:uncharacterized membrane protein